MSASAPTPSFTPLPGTTSTYKNQTLCQLSQGIPIGDRSIPAQTGTCVGIMDAPTIELFDGKFPSSPLPYISHPLIERALTEAPLQNVVPSAQSPSSPQTKPASQAPATTPQFKVSSNAHTSNVLFLVEETSRV